MAKLKIEEVTRLLQKPGRWLPGGGGAKDMGFHGSDPPGGGTKLSHVEVRVLDRRL